MVEELEHLLADSKADRVDVEQDWVDRVEHLVGKDSQALVPLINTVKNAFKLWKQLCLLLPAHINAVVDIEYIWLDWRLAKLLTTRRDLELNR